MKTVRLLLLFLFTALVSQAENYPYRSDVLWVTEPDHADWLYQTGDTARVDVAFYLYGMPQQVEVSYEIGPDMLPATRTGTTVLKDGKGSITIGTLSEPGFLDLRLTAILGKNRWQHHVKVGFSPSELKPCTPCPADFDQFWSATLREARKVPLTFTQERVPKYETDDTECFLLKLRIDQQHSVYAYLTKPRPDSASAPVRKYPVVLCPPGAGVKTIKEPLRHLYYAKNGFIRLEMEIHGLHPELSTDTFKDLSSAFGNYLSFGMDSRESYYLRHVYVACVRCIDFLTSLDEWDGQNVFVQGGSQGGALALITSALAPQVTACVANHPALSDMAGYEYHRAGGYPHFKTLTADQQQTLQYYDVVNFASRIKCPVYLTWGYNDNVCPPTTSYIVWNLITSPKDSLITPINEHWTSDDTEYNQMEWLKKAIR